MRLPEAHRCDPYDRLEDYLVDTPDGPLGVLDGWRRDEEGLPCVLLVAVGWLGRRRYEVPVGEILDVDHDAKRVLVATGISGGS